MIEIAAIHPVYVKLNPSRSDEIRWFQGDQHVSNTAHQTRVFTAFSLLPMECLIRSVAIQELQCLAGFGVFEANTLQLLEIILYSDNPPISIT